MLFLNTMQSKKDIYVLGIHDGHAAGAVLLKNGSAVAAISEERLTNVKNQPGVPVLSMQKVMDIARITPDDLTLVAVASKLRVVGNPETQYNNLLFKAHMATAPLFHSSAYIKLAVELMHRFKPRTGLPQALELLGIENIPIVFVDHHRAHASSAFYRRPWKDKALVFTLDGMGDGVSATVSIGEGDTLTRIAQTSFFDSLSDNMYSEITQYLGMRRAEHEYKVMGLAPYGDFGQTIDVFRSIIRRNPKKPLEFENRTRFYLAQLQPLYQKYLAKKRFDHIAAGVQKHFEELVTGWVTEAVAMTGIHKIAASGGSFLNVKTNMLLRNLGHVSDMFVYPACDDCGLADGAALVGYINYCQSHHAPISITPLKDIYYGQEFTDDAIEEFLKQKKLLRDIEKVDAEHIATLISQGKIIARFAGRDEWGPRALGNRSIMADPRDLRVVHRLNRAIKQRDFWMPFAPAILKEDQAKYIKNSRVAPYMVEAFETKTNRRADIIAAIHHADYTVRPQTVNDWNPGWQKIIREFKKITGVGAILNTSLNLHGYPLVGTPEQALWTFHHSDLDGLLFENWFISKRT